MTVIKTLLVTLTLIAFGATAIFAEQTRVVDKRNMERQEKPVRMDKEQRRDAAIVLKRTANVLMTAQKSVKRHRVYTGDLAKAYRHQQFAKELFETGDFDRSIRQSLRARQLANIAIRANKGRASEDYDRNESRYSKDIKADTLDKDFDSKRKPGEKDMSDDVIINMRIESDYK
jgi:hypothetical protein